MNERGGSRAWRRLREQVLRDQPLCQIRGPGCTGLSTTADHIIPKSKAPHLTMARANLRGACAHCNYSRGNDTRRRHPSRSGSPTGRARALAFFNPRG